MKLACALPRLVVEPIPHPAYRSVENRDALVHLAALVGSSCAAQIADNQNPRWPPCIFSAWCPQGPLPVHESGEPRLTDHGRTRTPSQIGNGFHRSDDRTLLESSLLNLGGLGHDAMSQQDDYRSAKIGGPGYDAVRSTSTPQRREEQKETLGRLPWSNAMALRMGQTEVSAAQGEELVAIGMWEMVLKGRIE